METPSKLLEQILFNTKPSKNEHRLIATDKSTHEEKILQPLQTKNTQIKRAVTFLCGYKGVFNDTNINNKFFLIL